jgi:hypothetical protein
MVRLRQRLFPPPAEAYFRMDRVGALLEAFDGIQRRLAGLEGRLDPATSAVMPPGAQTGGGSLMAISDPVFDAFFRPPPRLGVSSSWWMHVPFAQWLVRAAMPNVLVELGTHTGVSYAAFCQAVLDEALPTRCHAVDTWVGDRHVGEYGEHIYEDVRRFNDAHYGNFSTLLRMTFDDALGWFADGSIDLLHIDGLHTYEAVRHDFESWHPKLSDRAIVLFHDINVRWDDFGVWRYWSELRRQYPSFEFHFGYGLGVLAVGGNPPAIVRSLCGLRDPVAIGTFRKRFSAIGEHWQKIAEFLRLEPALADARSEVDRLRRESEDRTRAAETAQAEIAGLRDTLARLEAAAAQRVAAVAVEAAGLREQLAQLKGMGTVHAMPDAGQDSTRALASR